MCTSLPFNLLYTYASRARLEVQSPPEGTARTALTALLARQHSGTSTRVSTTLYIRASLHVLLVRVCGDFSMLPAAGVCSGQCRFRTLCALSASGVLVAKMSAQCGLVRKVQTSDGFLAMRRAKKCASHTMRQCPPCASARTSLMSTRNFRAPDELTLSALRHERLMGGALLCPVHTQLTL